MRLGKLTAAAVATAALVGGTAAVATATDGSSSDRKTQWHDSAAAQRQQIAAQFGIWNRALATGDADKVASLYTKDATLLATVSADIKEGRTEIRNYFRDEFLPLKPQGVITESHITLLDRDSAYRVGDYDFTLTNPDGTTRLVPARFTFVYEKVGGKWLIDSLHSSVQPGKG